MFEIEVTVMKTTERALLVRIEGDEPVWVPRSQVGEASEVEVEGDVGLLVVPEWLAREKGWVV